MANLALLTNSVTNASATNTRTVLQNNGHTVTLIADSAVASTDFSSYDAIVCVRMTLANAATIATELRAEIDGGKPVFLSMYEDGMDGFGTSYTTGVATRLRLIQNVQSWNANYLANGIEVVDNSHPITSGLSIGDLTIQPGDDFVANSGTLSSTYSGTLLAEGDPGGTGNTVPNKRNLIANEIGDLDLDGVALNARVVLLGSFVLRFQTYNTAGSDLIGSIMDWLLATPPPAGQELAARLEFGLETRPAIRVERTLAARLVMGLDTRANIHVATGKELAARLVFAVDMRPQLQVERQLAARLVLGVDQRLDIQVGAPGQQLAARLVFGLGIQPDTLQVTRTLSARLVFGLDTAAALLVTRQLAARLVMGMDLREGYVGPGTGLVVGGVRDPLATLREGDTFAIWLPWGGLQGTSGLAHVNSRRVSDERDEQELSLAIIPNDPANVPQLATGATPTPTADGQDLARKQARQAREIDKLERTKR